MPKDQYQMRKEYVRRYKCAKTGRFADEKTAKENPDEYILITTDQRKKKAK